VGAGGVTTDPLATLLRSVDPDTRRIILEMQEINRQMTQVYQATLRTRTYITAILALNVALFAATLILRFAA
jgi:hypothetical protein